MKNSLGQIHVYTGDGKGKTTAALGLALRARGRGLKVAIIFFDKGGFDYGERKILKKIGVDFWVTGCSRIDSKTSKFRFGVINEDKVAGTKGLIITKQLFKENKYDLLILDEINSATKNKIVNKKQFLNLLKQKPTGLELVLTGRDAIKEILDQATLVTEMKLIKHYYYQGVVARPGIEY